MATIQGLNGHANVEYTTHAQLQWLVASGAVTPETHEIRRVRDHDFMPSDFRDRGSGFAHAMDPYLGQWIDHRSDVAAEWAGPAPNAFSWDDWMFDTPHTGWVQRGTYIAAVWVFSDRVLLKRTGAIMGSTPRLASTFDWPAGWQSITNFSIPPYPCDYSISTGQYERVASRLTLTKGVREPDGPGDWTNRMRAVEAGVRINPDALVDQDNCWRGVVPGQSGTYSLARSWLCTEDGEPHMPAPRIPPATLAPLRLRFGFELETQATMGRRGSEFMQAPQPVLERWVAANRQDAMEGAFSRYIQGADPTVPVVPAQLDLLAVARSVIGEMDTPSMVSSVLNTDPQVPLVVKRDGTVAGVEIITRGGNTRAATHAAIDKAFSVEHVIDYKCSFHIHVSGPERQRWWWHNPNFQWYACEYIAAHMDQVPADCRARWRQDTWRETYFAVRGDTSKYRFVAFRAGTVEFRGWGNIRNPADAKAALQLTRNAFAYAYRRCANAARTPPATTHTVGDFAALSNIITGAA